MSAPGPNFQYSPLNRDAMDGQQFRVLILSPGQPDEPLHCDIQHASLDDPPKYEALSYTWGDPKGPHNKVPCKGDISISYPITAGHDRKTMMMGYNLMCALKQVRHETEPRTLWVDAICINQVDDEEKSWQVAQMAEIYSTASRVLAWLGEDDEYVDLAFDAVEGLCWAIKASVWRYSSGRVGSRIETITEEQVESVMSREQNSEEVIHGSPFSGFGLPLGIVIKSFRRTPPYDFGGMTLVESAISTFGESRSLAQYLISSGSPSSPKIGLDVLYGAMREVFIDRSYWSRLWIAQEFAHAQSVTLLCGTRSIHGELFHLISLLIFSNLSASISLLLPSLTNEDFWDLRKVSKRVCELMVTGEGLSKSPLSDTLRKFGFLLCSEIRDNIYALLNMSLPIPITVDYQISVSELFITTTKEIIAQDKSLNIIFYKPSLRQANSLTCNAAIDLPSWTPKFHTLLSKGLFTLGLISGLYKAGRPWEASSTCFQSKVPEVLNIYGIFSGNTVRKTFPAFLSHNLSSAETLWKTVTELKEELNLRDDVRPGTREALSVMQRLTTSKSLKISIASIFWETLAAGVYRDHAERRQRLRYNSDLEKEFYEAITAASGSSNPSPMLWRRLQRSLNAKTLCVLDNGTLALVHGDPKGDPKVGDFVFVADGASVPLIIRPVDPSFNLINLKKSHGSSMAFTFVGSAYIHGIMDGELPEEYEDSEDMWHEIQLV